MKNFYLLLIVATSVAAYGIEPGSSSETALKRVSRSTSGTILSQFDCDQISNCTSCVSTEHPCVWCIYNSRCTENPAQNCVEDELIASRSQRGYHLTGPSYCPHIASATDENKEILVPVGTNKTIQARIKIMQLYFLFRHRFQCTFEIENQKIAVKARPLGGIFQCDSLEFNYRPNATFLKVPFNIEYRWNQSVEWKAFDNPENLHVVIYRCNAAPNTKENCASLASKLDCSWCPSKNSCEMANECRANVSNKTDVIHSDLKQQNCRAFRTCVSCISADMNCNWCIDGTRCISQADNNKCRNDILVHSASSCPRITKIASGNILFTPADTAKHITAEVELVSQFLILARFNCMLEVGTQSEFVEAKLLGNTIYCDNFKIQNEIQASIVSAKFSIIWGENKKLENTNDMEVMIYRCNLLASSASTCSALPKIFGCAWCAESNSCQIPAQYPQMNRIEVEKNVGCQKFKTCTSCVNATAACSWCIGSNRCTDDINENCQNDILITSSNHSSRSNQSGAEFCPRITAVMGNKRNLIHDGKMIPIIRIQTENIIDFIVHTRSQCRFKIEGRVQLVNSRMIADTVYCQAVNFQYFAHVPNTTVSFAVIWGGANELDIADDIEIVIYRCRDMADTPAKCSRLSKDYACQWSTTSRTCELK